MTPTTTRRAIVRALGTFRRARARLQGQEAGSLVPARPHGARRSRSRIRYRTVAVDLRRVSAVTRGRRDAGPACAGTRGPARRNRADLDDDAVDDSVEPGASRSIPSSTTARTSTTARVVILADALAEPVTAATGRPFGRKLASFKGEQRRTRAVPPSAVRPRFARGARRLRHARSGHGRRAHGAGTRRRRLRHRRAIRPRDLRADRHRRHVHGGHTRSSAA